MGRTKKNQSEQMTFEIQQKKKLPIPAENENQSD